MAEVMDSALNEKQDTEFKEITLNRSSIFDNIEDFLLVHRAES